MANVVTAVAGIPTLQTFSRPQEPYYGPIPVCEIRFSNATLVPAIGVGDTGQYIYTMTLPINYVYRLLEAGVAIRGDTVSQTTRYENGMLVDLIQDGVTIGEFWLIRNGFGGAVDSPYEIGPGTNLTFGSPFKIVEGITDYVIDAQVAASIVVTSYCPTASSNNVNMAPFFRFAQYTVNQFNAGAMHTPILVT